MNSGVADLNHFAIKHFVVFWHAGNCSEAHFKDDVSASVLNEAIADLPIALLLLFIQKQNDVPILWVASANESFLNPMQRQINPH